MWLYIIYRQSLDRSEIPDEWKDAIITPIHKGGLRSLPKNYRPINLISHLPKVLEKVRKNTLVKFLENNNLMNKNQHGFRKHRSCLSQLLDHFDHIMEVLQSNKNLRCHLS